MKKIVFYLLALPLLVGATTVPARAKTPLVAVVLPGNLPRYQQVHEAFLQVLSKAGYGDDKVKIVVQKPNADILSITNSVRRLSAARADVLITYGSQATVIAKNIAPKAEVLFADVYDPVGLDIVKTLEAPGVNRTGASSKTSMASLLDTLLAAKPARSIGVLYNKDEEASKLQLQEISSEAARRGLSVVSGSAGSASSVPGTMEGLFGKADAIYLSEALAVQELTRELIQVASDKGVPVFCQIPGTADEGALVSLEADPTEQGNLLAVHAIQVLTGKKAFLLGVRNAKKVSLILNAASAQKLALALPGALVSQADRVVH